MPLRLLPSRPGARTKEIGIRKALGANVFGLTTLMTREFACLALIGALVAWPLSWWWMRDWLNGFAFRIDLAAWHFAAGAAIALVAVLVSSGPIRRIRRLRPIR